VNDQLQIQCGPAGSDGRRLVIATLNGKSHRDRFDVDSEFHRRHFRETSIAKLNLPDEAHEWIETRLIAAADAEDEGRALWQPAIIVMRDVTPLETDWLWPNYMPAGAITVLDGDPGLGKSQLTVDLAARLSRGDCMPPQSGPDGTFEPRSTLILNAEDDPARTLRPRLDAAGADPARVYFMRGMQTTVEGEDERAVVLPLDVQTIGTEVERYGVGLVIIDPFVAHLDGELNTNSDADVRRALAPVARMAEETGAAVVLVRHLNKKSGTSPKYRGGGSIGILGAARAAFVLGCDPQDADRRVLAPLKCNLAPEPPALTFTIEAVANTSRVCWGESTGLTAAELLDPPKSRGDSKLELAKGIISDILKEGQRGSNEVETACTEAGVSVATYRRAKRELGVISEKSAFDGQWILTLPGGPDDAEF